MPPLPADTNPLFLHWKKTQKEFVYNLELLQQRIRTDAVHDIRVATKKMRALLALFTRLQQEPEQAYLLQKTIHFFEVLGRYRDTEVCLSQCIAYEKSAGKKIPLLLAFFRQQLKTTRGWANQEIHRYHAKEPARVALLLKEEGSAPGDTFTLPVENLIRQQLEGIKKHWKQPHLVRKRLKEIYYWIPVLPEDSVAAWHPKELHAILDDLGNWQDLEILDQRMRHFRKDYLPESFEETGLLKDFQIHIREQKDLLFTASIKKLKTWIKKLNPM